VPWAEVEKENGKPKVYVELGVHELWPHEGPAGPATDAVHEHSGNGVPILPKKIINLGEAGHAIKQADPIAQLDAELVLLFIGLWGDFAGPGTGDNPGRSSPKVFPSSLASMR